MQKHAVKGFFASLVLLASGVYAGDNLSWHGFIAQGVTRSQDSAFITDDNAFSRELTEIGINAK